MARKICGPILKPMSPLIVVIVIIGLVTIIDNTLKIKSAKKAVGLHKKAADMQKKKELTEINSVIQSLPLLPPEMEEEDTHVDIDTEIDTLEKTTSTTSPRPFETTTKSELKPKVILAYAGPLKQPSVPNLRTDSLTSQPLPKYSDAWKFIPKDSALYGVDVESVREEALSGHPHDVLEGFKNPCWKSSIPDGEPMEGYSMVCHWSPSECKRLKRMYERRRSAQREWRLRCLPYFMLTGVTRSGVTDLRFFLSGHPRIQKPLLSEINWWNRRRQGYLERPYAQYSNVSFDEYLAMFDSAARQIYRNRTEDYITYDGSSFTFWEFDGWENIPLNHGLKEPNVTQVHGIRRIMPDVKLVVILRNPTERLYSHYSALKRGEINSHDFHERARYAIEQLNRCFQQKGVRECAFDTKLHENIYEDKLTIRASMYSVWLEEWLKVFPREQILLITSDEYFKDRKAILNGICRFLGIGSYSFANDDFAMDDINTFVPRQLGAQRPLLEKETKQMLDSFFKPFNARLAQLIGHSALWQD